MVHHTVLIANRPSGAEEASSCLDTCIEWSTHQWQVAGGPATDSSSWAQRTPSAAAWRDDGRQLALERDDSTSRAVIRLDQSTTILIIDQGLAGTVHRRAPGAVAMAGSNIDTSVRRQIAIHVHTMRAWRQQYRNLAEVGAEGA
jgi:hypothetical protein